MTRPTRHAGARTSVYLLVTTVLPVAGCAGDGPGAVSSPEESMTSDLPASAAGPAELECGASFSSPGDGELAVALRFPATVATGEQTVSGTATVAATRGGARGVVTAQAEAFLVRDGRVVTLPMPQDAMGWELELAEGASRQLPASAALGACSGEGRVAAGRYDLFVRVVLNRDDGSRADSFGGPWPLEVR